MPISNQQDARDLGEHIQRIFATSRSERQTAIRALFVEKLDFNPASGQVDLTGAAAGARLPGAAQRIARLDGVNVLYVPLNIPETDRVRKTEAAAAAKRIADQLGEDMLLVFTNTACSQLHFIRPDFDGAQPTLRRMVVERDLPRRTAVEQFSKVYGSYERSGSIRDALAEAFDVEPVTKQFFQEYKRVFEAAEERVSGFGSDEKDDKRLFVQTLFNRLMFVYFLSRKSWLTFRGNNDYLKALWNDYRAASLHTNFYISRLAPLFFAGLNNPQSRNLNRDNPVPHDRIGDVPFLNGGLFEKTDLDDRDGVTVPDDAIEPVLRDLFDKFNFTVMESTPFDIEVAVDPEMLGKVFEELVTGRHESGSYYTPRAVVSFMCREALKGYLEGQEFGASPEAIQAFVDRHKIGGISNHAHGVREALAKVRVVDPACGSGAYLLGMMQELVDLRTSLDSEELRRNPRYLYDLKLHIIQRNLYGVDIDEFAVNIAMLRMWLSLAIEYEGEVPEPLPNLDFKVVCGDSLLGPDPTELNLSGYQIDISDLARLKASYFRATARKEDVRRQVKVATEQLRSDLGATNVPDSVVDWRIEFAEVFAASGGFDIAIANPPYVRYQKISMGYKAKLKPLYAQATVGQSDLYCFFYVRAMQLLDENGMHVFVCSNSWLDVRYGGKLQEYLLKNAHIHTVYESVVERQFSTADINTIISVISKTAGDDDRETHFVSLRAEFDTALVDSTKRREMAVRRAGLLAAGLNPQTGKFAGDKWGAKYLRAPDIYHAILRRGHDKLVRLGDVATVKRGIITGANRFFFLKSIDVVEWGIEDEFLEPIMTTPLESSRISVEVLQLPFEAFVCHEPKASLSGTKALEYIGWGEAQGFHKKSAPAARRLWYDLGNRDTARTAINIFVHSTARTVLASQSLLFSDNFQVLYPHSVSSIGICSAMNSSFCQLVINVEGRANFGQGVLEIQTYEVSDLRIVNPVFFEGLDETILASSAWDVLHPSRERRQIDDAVFDILGLTQSERDGVYEAITKLVENRRRRARSV